MIDELKRLKRLSAIRTGNNIKFLTPAVYSGGWCPMRVACNIAEDVGDLSYLLIGMPECATYSRGMNMLPEGPRGEQRRIYVLDANEVVYGCRDGVIDAVKTMDADGAGAILMIATCVTDLIGEDFDGMIGELKNKVYARLAYVTLGQFVNFGSASGAWKTAEALGSLMEPRPAEKNTANALFIEPWRNKNETVKFPRIITALTENEVTVRTLAAGASLGDYMNAPGAALNLPLCSFTQPLAAKMERRFGVPYAPLHNAFGVNEIDGLYDTIAETFGINLGDRFGAWRDMALGLEERAATELGGATCAFLPGVDMPAALAGYLSGFGMEPIIMHIEDFHPEDAVHAKRITEHGYDPPVCRMMNIDKDIGIVRDMDPDICFGELPDPPAPIAGLKAAEEMGDFFGVVGYERTAGILSRIFTVLETGVLGERMDLYGPAPV